MSKLLKISERYKAEVKSLMPDEEAINRLALYFQNFSDQTRIKILTALSFAELCVNDLSKILDINQTTISHQLKSMKDQEVIESRRDGKFLFYRLKGMHVGEMMMYAVNEIIC